jgi:hypothetical protein
MAGRQGFEPRMETLTSPPYEREKKTSATPPAELEINPELQCARSRNLPCLG